MKDKLTALPVRGDSFVLQRAGRTIMVDSGWEGLELAKSLDSYLPEVDKINIAVCTHNDMDHAGGFTSLLDHWSPCFTGTSDDLIEEFWLPGKWVEVVPDLLTKAHEFADCLIQELDDFIEDNPNLALDIKGSNSADDFFYSPEKSYQGKYQAEVNLQKGADYSKKEDATQQDLQESEWMEDLRALAEDIIAEEAASLRALANARARVRYRKRKNKISPAFSEFWLSLIDAADRIRKIAHTAIKYSIKIRWFDFDEFLNLGDSSGGVPNILIPVNAVEQTPIPTGFSLGHILFLSMHNRKCLSFFSPPNTSQIAQFCPGVLFCGDSPMGSGRDYKNSFLSSLKSPQWPWLPVYVTAPHHGSESNAVAYDHISNWLGNNEIVWLRSGGGAKHPGTTYRTLSQGIRLCTHCPRKNLPKALIDITFKYGITWPFSPILQVGHKCNC
ncbi:hypothetical protein O4H49_11820 [Kiloniella laminariae]|uniref:Metallo-beta-lactamase domain-containing protein n=1 Tax=Kiloniella laminariae TaxID=454162 RepID=A0ABT4LK38_9PROT|nr:MBL fold metallo-hydrolase [Kiloniella laminariae]MCZ4281469.1 hypothetical protein [Kiloniella laminariae]